MPNIGTVLRDEISRLSRRATRSELDAAKKASSQHRRDIAVLKRQVAQLEREVKLLARKGSAGPAATPLSSSTKRVRFVAKGLRSQRNRLGLSAADFGKLIGVSAQSVYNWERGSTYPRGEQLSRLAAVRGIGKRDAAERLNHLNSKKSTIRRKPKR
jgi:DNA-binding XRE family transcriptional regulator